MCISLRNNLTLGKPDKPSGFPFFQSKENHMKFIIFKSQSLQDYCTAYEAIVHPETREIVLAKGEHVSRGKLDELKALGVDQIKIYW